MQSTCQTIAKVLRIATPPPPETNIWHAAWKTIFFLKRTLAFSRGHDNFFGGRRSKFYHIYVANTVLWHLCTQPITTTTPQLSHWRICEHHFSLPSPQSKTRSEWLKCPSFPWKFARSHDEISSGTLNIHSQIKLKKKIWPPPTPTRKHTFERWKLFASFFLLPFLVGQFCLFSTWDMFITKFYSQLYSGHHHRWYDQANPPEGYSNCLSLSRCLLISVRSLPLIS